MKNIFQKSNIENRGVKARLDFIAMNERPLLRALPLGFAAAMFLVFSRFSISCAEHRSTLHA
jgi:hypothetical protein